MCNCRSYNLGLGETPERVVELPSFAGGEFETVCIDECIADVILELWNRELFTLGSCCGHNLKNPSIVIPNVDNAEEYKTALREIDSREFTVHQWKLCEV